ncbi:MAG: trypsin-like peptidase domain-containing protein [Rhodobacteraceae bacterium]|nr:trypsin-like peptidase domain-containing protein [Paracoccaceae bacterium]
MRSVVSVLPVWPGHGRSAGTGTAPEGSGVILSNGIVATAWHVIEPASRITVRLSDGRVLPADLIGHDVASDIALLRVDADLQAFDIAPEPALADRACAVGNAFGLGLSITCGVVSATQVSDAGFNAVEDFVQTDAAINPGSSGGALVNADGQLVGMISAIFASRGDTNTGVGFAVSADLLTRVAEALLEGGAVVYPAPGWQLTDAPPAQQARVAAPVVQAISSNSAADLAGLRPGDVILEIGSRRVQTARDAVAALAILPEGTKSVSILVERAGQEDRRILAWQATLDAKSYKADCGAPNPVCRMRQAVFPVSSFDPIGSATRIGPDLLVTNRHIVGNQSEAVIHTPDGPRDAVVIPSSYRGDLVLLRADGLPDGGWIPSLDGGEPGKDVVTIGADIARQEIRPFDPGVLISTPAPDAELGRLHVTAQMQPGVSGGALVDMSGHLLGIAVGGGDGRFEAIPMEDIRALLEGRFARDAVSLTTQLGQDFAECAASLEAPNDLDRLTTTCSAAMNHGQLLEAGRIMAQAGAFDAAADLHAQAVGQVPNSLNARLSLLVSLQLAARFAEMTEHARVVMRLAPDDPAALRFGIQSGVWGGAPELAEEAYHLLLSSDPRQAEAARRFIDAAPPAPARRN